MPGPDDANERVVAVTAQSNDAGGEPWYRFGSGCVVAGRTVLTAAHVLDGAQQVWVKFPDRREYQAIVDPQLVGDPRGWRADQTVGPDLALLTISDPVDGAPPFTEMSPLPLGRVNRDAPGGQVERVRTLGYPQFADVPAAESGLLYRDTRQADGRVLTGSHLMRGLLDLQVSIAPRDLPDAQTRLADSPWSGMSGAPVLASGHLIGVVCEHAPRAGASSITVTPLTALNPDREHPQWGPGVQDPHTWWSRLCATGAEDLQLLPYALEAPYRARLREDVAALHKRMPRLLEREKELALIAAFATSDEPCLWLVGGAFAGKSALVYEAVTTGALPANVDVVMYFFNRRRSDASAANMLTAIVPQLEILCGWEHQDPTPYRFDQTWQHAAARTQTTGRHLLLLVDALDEDEAEAGLGGAVPALQLLPTLPQAHAHILVTSRPYPELQKRLDPTHPLAHVLHTRIDPFPGSAELEHAAKDEIDHLTRGYDSDVDLLGLLTAARGPLSHDDLAALHAYPDPPDLRARRAVTGLVERAARSLEPVGPPERPRYQYAHAILATHAQANTRLADPDYRDRIHAWADTWRNAGFPHPTPTGGGTPRYLLDTYPASLAEDHDHERLTALVTDIRWLEITIYDLSVDTATSALIRAGTNAGPAVRDTLSVISAQAHNLRPPHPVTQPGYIARQLTLQALTYDADVLLDQLKTLHASGPPPRLMPIWTTAQTVMPALQLGQHGHGLTGLAVLPDGRVVTSGGRGVLVWDPAHPGAPDRIGDHSSDAGLVAVLSDGRVVTGNLQGEVLVWDPAHPGAPDRIGDDGGRVTAVAALPDGRVVTGNVEGEVLVWDPAHPGAPDRIGDDSGRVTAVAVLPEGRVVTASDEGRVLVADPAHPGSLDQIGDHGGEVTAVAVLPDGRVVTAGDEGVLVWDPTHPGAPDRIGDHGGKVTAVAVLPDGRVVTHDVEGQLLVWDPTHPAAPDRIGNDPYRVGLAVLPDGRVVTGSRIGRVLLWDPAHPGDPDRVVDYSRGMGAVAVLPNGRVVTAAGDENGVLVWDPAHPGAPERIGDRGDMVGVMAVGVLPDGRVVTGNMTGQLLVWDPAHPRAADRIGDRGGRMTVAAVLLDGRVVTGNVEGQLLVWDPAHPGAPDSDWQRPHDHRDCGAA